MFLRALLAFLVLPGGTAVLAPPLIASLDPWRGSGWWPGAVVMALGAAGLVWCVRDFYVAGKGTLAPWDPPRQLVVAGLYRWVRNPMYLGVLALVSGWALALTSPLLAGYAGSLAVAFHLRVSWHEEPWLEGQFGEAWAEYRIRVPRWLPRKARSNGAERA